MSDHDEAHEEDGLGSLTQQAQKSSLKSAQSILIVLGVLFILVHAFYIISGLEEKEIDRIFQAEIKKMGPNVIVDQNKLNTLKAEALKITDLVHGGFIAVGVVLIILGIVIHKIPVVATVLGLCIYISCIIILAVLQEKPAEFLAQGLIIKILIIVGLSKAIQSAVAYQKEKSRLASEGIEVVAD